MSERRLNVLTKLILSALYPSRHIASFKRCFDIDWMFYDVVWTLKRCCMLAWLKATYRTLKSEDWPWDDGMFLLSGWMQPARVAFARVLSYPHRTLSVKFHFLCLVERNTDLDSVFFGCYVLHCRSSENSILQKYRGNNDGKFKQ